MAYTPFIAPTSTQDLKPNSFGGVGGNYQSQGVISQYQMYKPNELIQVFERHNYAPSFRMMLKTMGFRRGSYAPTIGHYEYPWRKNLITVGTIVTPSAGPGTSVVISLDAGDMYNAGVTVGGVAAQASYPIKGELVLFPDGNMAQIIAKDTSVTPHRLTLRPVNSTVDLATSIVVGEAYFIASNAWGEGTGLPEGRVPRVVRYSNTFQIVKQAAGSTGSELTNQMYFEPVEGKPGSFFAKVSVDAMWRFETECDGALLWGQQINNITEFNPELGFDVNISGTEGLIRFATVNGNTDTYTVGNFQMADFDDISRYYERERIGINDIMALQGIDINIEIENVLIDLLDGDLAAMLTKDYMYGDGMFMDAMKPKLDASDFAMKFGFRAVKKSGYRYYFYCMPVFNENVGAGAAGYDYPNWQVMFPVGYAKEKSSGDNRATIGYEYKQLGAYSREEVIADISGVGVAGSGTPYRIASNQFDLYKMGMVAEIAFHGTCANHITLVRPA
jgi:hypothetical protein